MNLRFELFVKDPVKSVLFYRDILGFRELPSFGNYHQVRRDSVVIGIGAIEGMQSDHYFKPEIDEMRKGLGIEIVLEVDDVEAVYEQVKSTEYPIAEDLKEQQWGLTDFRVIDPDGYYLRITSKK